MDTMIVHAEASPSHAAPEARAAAGRDLAEHIKSVIGVTATVEVHEPSGVARSEGKARRVVDNRAKG